MLITDIYATLQFETYFIILMGMKEEKNLIFEFGGLKSVPFSNPPILNIFSRVIFSPKF